MTVLFHGNFGLDRGRMSKLVKLGLSKPNLSEEELAKPFGYKKPFTQKYRSWLHKTGITDIAFPLSLTEMGAVVFKNDPEFATDTTKWFMHWELTQHKERAEAWHFFANEFLPNHKEFSREDLLKGVMMKLRSHSEMHFGPKSKLNPIIVRKLIDCYTKTEALGDLGIIKPKGKLFVRKKIPEFGPWSSSDELSKAYKR